MSRGLKCRINDHNLKNKKISEQLKSFRINEGS